MLFESQLNMKLHFGNCRHSSVASYVAREASNLKNHYSIFSHWQSAAQVRIADEKQWVACANENEIIFSHFSPIVFQMNSFVSFERFLVVVLAPADTYCSSSVIRTFDLIKYNSQRAIAGHLNHQSASECRLLDKQCAETYSLLILFAWENTWFVLLLYYKLFCNQIFVRNLIYENYTAVQTIGYKYSINIRLACARSFRGNTANKYLPYEWLTCCDICIYFV